MAAWLQSSGVSRLGKRGFLAFVGVLLVVGCNNNGASNIETKVEGDTCRNDDECGPDSHCDFAARSDLLGLAMPVSRPCMLQQCEITNAVALCTGEQTCVPVEQARRLDGLLDDSFTCIDITHVCGTRCAEDANCNEGELCRDNGRCERPWCDEPGGLTCPDGTRCERELAARQATASIRGALPVEGFANAVQRGCALIACDQEGAIGCQDLWRCDTALNPDLGGCVPIACQESGLCSSDGLICEPTSARSRPGGVDAHGCVWRNCEEGITCSAIVQQVDVGYCDFEGPLVQSNGCAARRCDEVDGLCPGSLVCEPGARTADARGCRFLLCTEGSACPATAICDPAHADANARGCVVVTNTSDSTTAATSNPTTAPTSAALTTASDTSTSNVHTGASGSPGTRSSDDVPRTGVCVVGAAS